MKRIIHGLWEIPLLMVPIMALSSCADDIPDVVRPDNGLIPMEFKATIMQESTTRADESGFADGDRMGVFVVRYTDGVAGALSMTNNIAGNVAMRFNSGEGTWSAPSDIYWPDNTTMVDVYGYYPFNNALSDVEGYGFEVSADQSKAASDGDLSTYESSDFLWAKTQGAQPGNRIDLSYHHKMAGVKVILQQGEGFDNGEFDKLTKVVTVDNTIRNASINLSTGEVAPAGGYDRNIVMNPESDCYRAVVVPQTVDGGKSTIGITIDGISYCYKYEGGMTYTSGKLHTFTMMVGKKTETGGYKLSLVSREITDWQSDNSSHDFEANSYFVVECPEAGKLQESITKAGADYRNLKNLKVRGKLDYTDCDFIREKMESLASLNIKEVEFPENKLPDGAFHHNKTIRRYILSETIVEIGAEAFWDTEPSSAIVIPESVVKIGDKAFWEIWETGEIVLPGKLEYVGERAFETRAKFEMRLPSTLKYIGDYAFANCPNAYGAITIPPNLEYFGYGAFNGTGINPGDGQKKGDLSGEIVIPTGLVDRLSMNIYFVHGTNITLPEGIREIDRLGGKFNSTVVLPQSLERIEREAFYCTEFPGPIELPANLVFIGFRAFLESNLSGKIVIPDLIDCVSEEAFNKTRISEVVVGDQVLQIEKNAFGRNEELKRVELGKNIEFIGAHAFSDCPQLQLMVVNAKEPPYAPEAFTGCDFTRTIIEVPEGCVDAYRHADGWKQFQNITEHHELAVDVSEIKCLHKGITRSAKVRAEGNWTVSVSDSWISVNQMTGTAKDEIEIIVASQEANAQTRQGTVTLALEGTDYKTVINVTQMASENPEDTLITLNPKTAATGNPIPLIILGDGFTADDIYNGSYKQAMEKTMDYFFAIEPYKSLKEYFTVVTAPACSSDEGISNFYSDKATKFGSYEGVPEVEKVRNYITEVFGNTFTGDWINNATVIMVENYDVFTGWSSIESDGLRIASIGFDSNEMWVYPYDQRGLVQHYAGGAAFAGLGEESVSHFEHIKSCKCPCCNMFSKLNEMKAAGYYANLSLSGKMNDVAWRDFIFHQKYSADVDMWEGGYNHLRGVWRSESQSVMGTFIGYYNAISRYTIYKAAMHRAGLAEPTFEEFVTLDKIEKP